MHMLKKSIMKQKPMIPLLGLLACACLVLSACQKELSIETNQNLAAAGSLQDTAGNCMPETVVGTFYDGVEPGRDTAYVVVNVNVTNPGSYSIYTNTQNGFYFSDSGYFTNTGLQTVKLRPVGVPIIPDSTLFNVTFDSSICSFTVYVKDSTGTGLGGGGITNPNQSDSAWKFNGPSGSYHGPVDTAYTKDTLGELFLYVTGFTSATGDTAFQAGVAFSGGAIAPGSYSSQSSALFRFTDLVAGTVIYSADPTVTGANTIVNINSYDPNSKIVTGTFSGSVKDSGGNIVNINSGTFTAKVQ